MRLDKKVRGPRQGGHLFAAGFTLRTKAAIPDHGGQFRLDALVGHYTHRTNALRSLHRSDKGTGSTSDQLTQTQFRRRVSPFVSRTLFQQTKWDNTR